MNLILKAMNAEGTKIRMFPVAFSNEHSFAVIYEFLPEHETYLRNLVDGIKSMVTNENMSVYCTDMEMFSEVTNVKKVSLSEDGTPSLIEPKVK